MKPARCTITKFLFFENTYLTISGSGYINSGNILFTPVTFLLITFAVQFCVSQDYSHKYLHSDSFSCYFTPFAKAATLVRPLPMTAWLLIAVTLHKSPNYSYRHSNIILNLHGNGKNLIEEIALIFFSSLISPGVLPGGGRVIWQFPLAGSCNKKPAKGLGIR